MSLIFYLFANKILTCTFFKICFPSTPRLCRCVLGWEVTGNRLYTYMFVVNTLPGSQTAQHCSAIFSLSLFLWLYLCNGLHLILIWSDSTRPLTVYCSCSTSVGFSHWQLEDTFHIVLGLWFGVSCIAAHSTHSFFFSFFFLFCVCNESWNKHCLKHTHARLQVFSSLFISVDPADIQHIFAFLDFPPRKYNFYLSD